MVASALAFSLMTVAVKVVGERLPSQEIVLARAIVSLVLSYGLLRRAGVATLGTRRGLLALRGVCGFLGLSCVFYAVTHLPLAEATVLQYLHPTFTALIAAVALRERIGFGTTAASLLSLLGVVLVARPEWLTGALVPGAHAGPPLAPLALAAAIGGAFFSGAAYVVVRRLARTEHPLVIVLYFPLITVPATLPTLIGGIVWPSGVEWLWLLAIGVLTQIGQVALTHGLARLPAARGTALSYVQVVFAIVWGALFFGEVPGWSSWIGAGLVIAGTGTIALLASRPSRSVPIA